MPAKKAEPAIEVLLNSWGTSTLLRKIEDETESVRGRGNATYNPDWEPPQNEVLKGTVNINSRSFREKLGKNSSFLRVHTADLLREIVRRGWICSKKDFQIHKKMQDYKPAFADEPKPYEDQSAAHPDSPEWDTPLKLAFIEAVTKAMVIDSAFITRFTESENNYYGKTHDFYRIFTSNNVYRAYGNDDMRIDEIYFTIPRPGNLYLKGRNNLIYETVVGFLTQYSPLETAPANQWIQNKVGKKLRESKSPEKSEKKNENKLPKQSSSLAVPENNIGTDEITRNCVHIMPLPSILDVYGEPYLRIENQTALEKIALRAYEFAVLENGGVKKFIALAASLDADSQSNLVTETKRGIKSRGTVLKINGGQKVSDLVLSQETAIPDLPFDIVNSHLSEDAQLSKQGVEGAAQTGALGGQAPVQNARDDETAMLNLHPILEKIIADINDVYFQLDPDDYDIYFLPASINPSALPMMNSMPSSQAETPEGNEEISPEARTVEVAAHSVNDTFVQFDGHMLPAGKYLYPDRPERPSDIFTPDEVKEMAEKEVRTGYLEINHSDDPLRLAFGNNAGYYQIKGFDEKNHWDNTTFFIRKEIYHTLHSPQKIKVSPRLSFIRDGQGRKHLQVINCAIITEGLDRASLSGLDASAVKVDK